ncbi:ATPase get3a [Prototheca wickerhamii]|uniref:ATPase get3a n=1 Tax=Prototheca wickerhamii TaxID=3111 RepID=A0AAD9IFK4_PROWI|nr:ATPase get3a [Prototheca wickerhamii]
MDYSCIVFDTAPTGHTLRLLQFPTALQKGLGKLMELKESFGGMLTQLGGLLGGPGQEDIIAQATSKLTALKAVVEEVNRQFQDPDLTTFVCVCIPEFLSLYETERLIQELARYNIDTRNVVINQILFPDGVGTSRLLEARLKMQQKYLDQYFELYDDFHVVQLPLLPAELPPGKEEIKAEIARLEARITELKDQLVG